MTLGVVVAVLYLLTAVLAVFVVLLYRQFGLLSIGSAVAVRLPGPRAGTRLRPSSAVVQDADGRPFTLDLRAAGRFLHLVFVAPGTPFDVPLGDGLRTFGDALGPDEEVVVVSKRSLSEDFAARAGPGVRALVDPDGALFRACDVEVLPAMFVIDHRGVLVCRDLVNTVHHLATLRGDAHELGPHERARAGRK